MFWICFFIFGTGISIRQVLECRFILLLFIYSYNVLNLMQVVATIEIVNFFYNDTEDPIKQVFIL